MNNYELFCNYCGANLELQNGFTGKTITICRYGRCHNDYQNCKARTNKYLNHRNKDVRDFAVIVKLILDSNIPVMHYNRQLISLAKNTKNAKYLELPLKI